MEYLRSALSFSSGQQFTLFTLPSMSYQAWQGIAKVSEAQG